MWEQKAPSVAICSRLKAGLGEASPIPPLGRWEKKLRVEFLTIIPAFVASQKCKSFAFRQNHITTPEGVVPRGLQPRFYRGRYSRARGEG